MKSFLHINPTTSIFVSLLFSVIFLPKSAHINALDPTLDLRKRAAASYVLSDNPRISLAGSTVYPWYGFGGVSCPPVVSVDTAVPTGLHLGADAGTSDTASASTSTVSVAVSSDQATATHSTFVPPSGPTSTSTSQVQPAPILQSTSTSQSDQPSQSSPLSRPEWQPVTNIAVSIESATLTTPSVHTFKPAFRPDQSLESSIASILLTSKQQQAKNKDASSTKKSPPSETDTKSSSTSPYTPTHEVVEEERSSSSATSDRDILISQLSALSTETQVTASPHDTKTMIAGKHFGPPCPKWRSRSTVTTTIFPTTTDSAAVSTETSDLSTTTEVTQTSVTLTSTPVTALSSVFDSFQSSASNSLPSSSDSTTPSAVMQTTISVSTYWSIINSSIVSDTTSSSMFTPTTSVINSTPSTDATSSTSLIMTAPPSSISVSTPYSSSSLPLTSSVATPSNTQTASPEPRYRGFNVVNQSPANSALFKSPSEWDQTFGKIKALPGHYNAVRLYSTTDGPAKHLSNALPYARKHNLSIHAGVWSGGDGGTGRFEMEITALKDALSSYGCDNIVAVSVGNEDMYMNHPIEGLRLPLTDPLLLVRQVQNVTDILNSYGCGNVKVTHTDTFGAWLNASFSEPLIRKVDFLTVNIFPYWEGQDIESSGQVFWQQVNETRQMAARYGKDIWIGETGWPTTGAVQIKAVPSLDNLRRYWEQIGCDLTKNMNAFWYAEWDAYASTSFGLTDMEGKSIIGDLSCA